MAKDPYTSLSKLISHLKNVTLKKSTGPFFEDAEV
jgi:hypothetical protein